MRKSAVDFRMDSRRATLHVRNLCTIDTFQFLGPNDTPAVADLRVRWEATGPAVPRGKGKTVPPTDPAAFLGEIAPAIAEGSFEAEEIGFEFESSGATTAKTWAQIGTERNGVFL